MYVLYVYLKRESINIYFYWKVDDISLIMMTSWIIIIILLYCIDDTFSLVRYTKIRKLQVGHPYSVNNNDNNQNKKYNRTAPT